MSSVCPGCSALFTASGLAKHLSQTNNPACISVRREQAHQFHPPPSQSETQADGLFAQDIDLDSPPVIFEGDFFGDYTEQDFEDGPRDSSSSSDDELDLFGVGGWEPPVQTSPHSDIPPQAVPPAEPPVQHSLPLPSARGRVEQDVRRKTHVVPFPSNAAGAPIPLNSSGSARNPSESSPSYERYQSYITPEQPSLNPYAPFGSRLDWEVARWAKLRGSGSTAFSDLLAIEDVSLSYHTIDDLVLSRRFLDRRTSFPFVQKLPRAQQDNRQPALCTPALSKTRNRRSRGGV